MLRRGLIIAQAALAGGLAIATMSSYVTAPVLILPLTARHQVALVALDGRGRIFLLEGDTPFELTRDRWGSLYVQAGERLLPMPDDVAGPPNPGPFLASIRIGNRREVGPFGGSWRAQLLGPPPSPRKWAPVFVPRIRSTYLRIPLWPLVILLMYVPIRQAMRERRTAGRRLRNECLACGYSLTGLIEPRCPECGTQA